MHHSRVTATIRSIALATLFATTTAASAQDWPTKAITAVVPFGPGTSLDIVGRPIFDLMSQQLGQPIVLEHRPGGGSIVGSAAVARAAPDGHTMLLHSSSFSISYAVNPNRPYDAVRDFIPVIPFGVQPYALLVSPSRGYKTLADLIAAAKAKPGAMNFATAGVGSAPHIAAEILCLNAGIQAQHVPYRGPAEALAEILAGRIDFYFIPVGSVLGQIKDGKLGALAVSTTKRAKDLPDVPTLQEAGVAAPPFELWNGLFLPAHTPDAIVRKLHAAGQKALEADSIKQRLATIAVEPLAMTQEQFAAYVRKDIEDTAALVKKAGIAIPQ